MKTMKIVVLVLLASAVTFVACQKDQEAVNQNVESVKVDRPWNMLSYKEMIERLEDYDKTRKPILEKALGYEDTRINFYSIETIENYIAYVKQLSKEKGIELTGIDFVSATYPKDADYGTPGYQNIMFMPTTNINGKNIAFDPVQSTKDNIVTMKEMLARYGYNWIYGTKNDYDKRDIIDPKIVDNYKKRDNMGNLESGAANASNICPPYDHTK